MSHKLVSMENCWSDLGEKTAESLMISYIASRTGGFALDTIKARLPSTDTREALWGSSLEVLNEIGQIFNDRRTDP